MYTEVNMSMFLPISNKSALVTAEVKTNTDEIPVMVIINLPLAD